MRSTLKLIALFALLLPLACYAEGLASNLQGITDTLGGFVSGIAQIIGLMVFILAITQYFEHRKSPTQVPISKPIMYLLLGILLIVLPYLGKLSDSATNTQDQSNQDTSYYSQ